MREPIRKFNYIYPGDRDRYIVDLRGSKSITNRAIIAAALRTGKTFIDNASASEDTKTLLECIKDLGFPVIDDADGYEIWVTGFGGEIPVSEDEVYVGDCGTAARFLPALLALKKGGKYTLTGTQRMCQRPMKGLFEALQKLGCEFEWQGEEWRYPCVMTTHGIPEGIEVEVDTTESSQFYSALLMVSKVGKFKVIPKGDTVSKPFIHMTERVMFELDRVTNGQLTYVVEGDMTAASYFAMIPLVQPSMTIMLYDGSLTGLQGDAKFITEMKSRGLISVELDRYSTIICTKGTSREGFTMDFKDISDTFPTLAALTPILSSPTTITGIRHTKGQESDRIEAIATELRKIVGVNNVTTTDDSITVTPCPIEYIKARAEMFVNGCIPIDPHGDHRIAMSFAILGLADIRGDNTQWIKILDEDCVDKSYPDFFWELTCLTDPQAY